MGGPVNKICFSVVSAFAASGIWGPAAGKNAAAMAPPMGMAISALVLTPKKYTEQEREDAKVAIAMSLCQVTEGALPFAFNDPKRVIPAVTIGSGVAHGLILTWGVTVPVLHGGIFSVPLASNPMLWIAAWLIGAMVTAVIVSVTKPARPVETVHEDGEWKFKDVVSIPYVHRFGIFHANGINYLIAATVATSKKEKNDWSVPGRIYVAELPEDPAKGVELEILVDGLYRNHGFWQTKEVGKDVGYFGSDQGILRVSAPQKRGGQWKTELIMEGHIGEIATVDIDNDGEDEIMTIEEFHGDTIQIYKKINGKYTKVWKYDNEIDFAHALVGTKLAGQNAFVCGVRRKDCELFAVTYEDGEYKVTMIEKGVGPANLCVVNEKDRDIIVAANHTANEAAVYFVTE